MNQKLEKIKLSGLEMSCFFGGACGDDNTYEETTSQKGNCTDEDTSIDINGVAYKCTQWTCP